MSRKSVRKVRHRPDAPKVFSFKERVQMGQITKKINAKEITLEEIQANPKTAWMIEAWTKIKTEALQHIELSADPVQEMMPIPHEYPAQANEPSESNEPQ